MCSGWGTLLEQHPSHRTHSLSRRTPDLQPSTKLDNTPYCRNHSLTLLKMEKRLPETRWADSKINKIVIVASSWSFILFTYIDDTRSNTNQTFHHCFNTRSKPNLSTLVNGFEEETTAPKFCELKTFFQPKRRKARGGDDTSCYVDESDLTSFCTLPVPFAHWTCLR